MLVRLFDQIICRTVHHIMLLVAASKDGEESPKESDEPSRTLNVTNLSSVLTSEQLKQLFSYCGTVTDIKLSDSKQSAHVEYSTHDEAKAALALNNMEVGSRKITVELEKKSSKGSAKQGVSRGSGGGASALATPPPLPMMMQQAVAMQQLQFQQALFMQQAMTNQQAAARAATVKSAAEMAASRALEISRSLNPNGEVKEEKEKSPSRYFLNRLLLIKHSRFRLG
jgi:RNA recognition motif-containing protein